MALERALGFGQQLRGSATAGGRVDEQ